MTDEQRIIKCTISILFAFFYKLYLSAILPFINDIKQENMAKKYHNKI